MNTDMVGTADSLAAGRCSRRTRRGIALGAAGTLGAAAVELGADRHWDGTEQLVAWIVTASLSLLLVAAIRARRRGTRLAVRRVALTCAAASVYGVVAHVHANYEAGPLDFRFTDKWQTMTTLSRVWAATNGSVGPAPLLAPLILAQAAILISALTLSEH